MERLAIVSYPPADPAPDAWEGKFVQLTVHGGEHLVFAARVLHQFHNQILARFLGERAVPHRWVDPQTLAIASTDVAVAGGGRFRVDNVAHTLDLWDNSQAYGRFNDQGLAEKIAAAEHRWHTYRIQIS